MSLWQAVKDVYNIKNKNHAINSYPFVGFLFGTRIVAVFIEGFANGKCSAFNARQTEKEAYIDCNTQKGGILTPFYKNTRVPHRNTRI